MEEETTTKVITSTTILPSRNEEKEKEEDLCENRGRIVYPKAARQVAGNSHKHARAARVDACGHFYKPTDDTRKGMTELQFYEKLASNGARKSPGVFTVSSYVCIENSAVRVSGRRETDAIFEIA